MANLIRYSERANKFGIEQLLPTVNGEYVKFADVAEALKHIHQQRKGEICPVCGGLRRIRLVSHVGLKTKNMTIGKWYKCFNCVSRGKISPVS